MIRQYELVDRVKTYDPRADEDALNRAYVFSMKAHGSQLRASGDPYFSHPIEVAGILTDLKLDSDSIVTGLLHDTVEDTVATLDEIEAMFGHNVAQLVDGVTKLSRLELQSADTRQAENFRKLLLATSRDIRVLLVKLADRLHNMRTLHHIKSPEKRVRIARETMDIYAPLAERIGMQRIKDELEDLCFETLYPEARDTIIARLDFLREQGHDHQLTTNIADQLRETLAAGGVAAEVIGREKRPYSIWRKMQRQNVEFAQLSDIMAFRVVVDDIAGCYRALGVIHTRYSCVPGRFKDYVSTPKRNGYKSLHTVIIGPEQRRIEVQIRTREMHEIAEYGVAAHWQYKQSTGQKDGPEYRWLRELLDILEHAAGPDEFLEHTKLDLFQDQVFCFTPKGELIALPRGATPVDFAYEVHSEVGDACVGAKINGRMVPLRTQLSHGDQVEVITSHPGSPSPDWERFVVTGKARAAVRRFIRTKQRTEYRRLGEAILRKAFRDAGYELGEAALRPVMPQFHASSVEDLYVALGAGHCTGADVLAAALDGKTGMAADGQEKAARKRGRFRFRKGSRKDESRGQNGTEPPIPIRGLIPGMAVHYAGCCHPLPGDRIVGIVTPGKGVSVHTIECETLESFQDAPERWVDIAWDLGQEDDRTFVGRLNVVVANERGGLANLATVVARHFGNINNLKITDRSSDFFTFQVDIEVNDNRHLNDIIAALRAVPEISSVERAWS
jgi:GTP diphosphokinase / guanosine-3',5'-bis(diphosphate) 3'-diphosphatase